MTSTTLLDRIDTPADLRTLTRAQLKTLATELRQLGAIRAGTL